jgi:hypothetical protein
MDASFPAPQKWRVYTGSELRWIYRNRQDPRVAARLQFWQDMQPCFPPWEQPQWRRLWQTYRPTPTAQADGSLEPRPRFKTL